MFRRHLVFNVYYIGIIILNICALVFDHYLLRMVSTPLICSSLILYLLIKTKIQERFCKLIFIGLVLSLASDIQSLFSVSPGFYLLSALFANLLAYCFFAAAFSLDFRINNIRTKRLGNVALIILGIICIQFYFTAKDNLKEFALPIILYSVVLTAMVALAAYRYKSVNRLTFKLILAASVAFLISDLSSGYYNFIDTENYMRYSYLLAYLTAQYLVVIGTIERRRVAPSAST